MTQKYTAEDFANARFAEDPDGNIAARFGNDPIWPWTHSGGEYKDESMARFGWVPVPTKPTITKSGVVKVFEASKSGIGGTRTALTQLGIEVIPDPEPTNTEKLEELLVKYWDHYAAETSLAKYLDSHSVYVKDN